MVARRKNRRTQIVINEGMQRRIINAITLVPMGGLAISTLIVAVFCRRLLSEALAADAELPSLTPLFAAVLIFFVICSLVMGVQGLRFSHRIAGPTYRLCQSMERIRSGDIAFRVTLRKGDYLTEAAAEFNKMLDWLNENPPQGVITGSDVVEVHAREEGEGGIVDCDHASEVEEGCEVGGSENSTVTQEEVTA